MSERLRALAARRRAARRPWLLFVGAVVGFVAVLGASLDPPDPESRLPGGYRLAALIQRQQHENEQHRRQVEDLRTVLERERSAALSHKAELVSQTGALQHAGLVAGTVPVAGNGFSVTLDDSSLSESPTDNVNDLVIHSQDVQAIVNGMWNAGAEAVAINGQRLVGTSAILCVGNTLLLNGTVHAPPYVVSGIGADRDAFNGDPLVRRLKSDADRFSLRFSAGRDEWLELPGYSGPTNLRYAQPINS